MTKTEQFTWLKQHGAIADKVLFRPILMHFAADFIGKTYGEFASDYRVLAEANLRCMEEFDLDMVGLISDPYRETSAFGAQIRFVADGVPRCLNKVVQTMEDVMALKNPDVYQADRTLDRIRAGELLSKKTGGKVPVIGWIEGPLAEACDLAGVEQVMLQLMMDPDFVERLMDKCLITAKDFALAQIQAGCKIIGIGDAVCSQIDAGTYDAMVRERHAELIEFIHQHGAAVKLHICGDTTHLLPFYKSFQPDILDLDWQVDPGYARSVLGDQVILAGNINPVLVQDKSRDEVYLMSKELVEKYKSERFILSAGCEITVLTPQQNLMAMREASVLS